MLFFVHLFELDNKAQRP